MIERQCHHCGRFSKAVTEGVCCPHCGHRAGVMDKVAPVALGLIVFMAIIAFLRLALS